ncbi:hypothetical protein TNIN_128931 [Trichonephila inaurata madagascariensis]|uniref:Uncharacterized protein n=1 Tax=Trichonephila inaurata madagascariensis TaxID=2747483 RepID=A0A8X6YLX8_9ARAC|nr:hypothetical protein TNIN_128931 [Trichonephila inaurata madagascariensis]
MSLVVLHEELRKPFRRWLASHREHHGAKRYASSASARSATVPKHSGERIVLEVYLHAVLFRTTALSNCGLPHRFIQTSPQMFQMASVGRSLFHGPLFAVQPKVKPSSIKKKQRLLFSALVSCRHLEWSTTFITVNWRQ